MKKKKPIRKRFYKPYHFLNKAGNRPSRRLAEVFHNFPLGDFRRELQLWQRLALANDQSAYDKGCGREDLLDFLQALHRLIEAFHVVNEKWDRPKKKNPLEGSSKRGKKTLSRMDIPVLLNREEQEDPRRVIEQFCTGFKRSYVKMELLDLLDAVITYEGNKKVYRGNLVLFYQHIQYLALLAYSLTKKKTMKKT